MNFKNGVTKMVQMAHKVAQVTKKIEIEWNCLKIGTEPILNVQITNMNITFEDIVTKGVKMSHKVA